MANAMVAGARATIIFNNAAGNFTGTLQTNLLTGVADTVRTNIAASTTTTSVTDTNAGSQANHYYKVSLEL